AMTPTSMLAKIPRTSMTCAMFIESDTNLAIASLTVNAAMEMTMNKAPRRLGERAKAGFAFSVAGCCQARGPLQSARKSQQRQTSGPRTCRVWRDESHSDRPALGCLVTQADETQVWREISRR